MDSLYGVLLPWVSAKVDQDRLVGVVDLVMSGQVGHHLSWTEVSALDVQTWMREETREREREEEEEEEEGGRG